MRSLVPLLLLLASPAVAQNTRALAPGAKSPPATIADAAWLHGGAWRGSGLGAQAVEVYSAPVAHQMSGHFELVAGGKVRFYEIMQIAKRDGSLVYRLKHFNPDLTGWEAKDEVLEFPLVARDPDALHSDGMSFLRTGEDSMTVWVRIDDRQGGKSREERFDYHRER